MDVNKNYDAEAANDELVERTQMHDGFKIVYDEDKPNNAAEPVTEEVDQDSAEDDGKKHVPTNEEIEKMSPEEKMKILDKYTKVIDIGAKQSTLHKELDSIFEQKNEVGKMLKAPEGGEDPMETVNRKLATVKDAVELAEMLKDPAKIDWFFEDDGTGLQIECLTPNEQTDLREFERDLLLFLKRCDDAADEYERMSDEIAGELKALDAEFDEVNAIMQDNVVAFADAIADTITPDNPNYKRTMAEVRGIRSAYDFEILKTLVDAHPGIIDHTLEEFRKEGRITDIGKRYATKLDRAKTSANLITFLPRNPNDRCIEKHIIPNEYMPGTEDLFVYILIRHFAMSSFDDQATRKFHASVYLMLYQLVENQLKPELITKVHDNMLDLLQRYYAHMPVSEAN